MPDRFLIFTNTSRAGEKIQLESLHEVTLGRGPNNTVVLKEKKVSRNHAVIAFQEDGTATIEDLKSTNGVFVNNIQTAGATALHSGDKIQIGRHLFTFMIDEAIDQTQDEAPRTAPLGGATEIHDRGAISSPYLLSGRIEELGLADILQTLNRNKKTGKLILTQEIDSQKTEAGFIEFAQGSIAYVQAGNAYSNKALYRLLRLSRGSFKLLPLSSENLSQGPGKIEDAQPLEAILLEAYRHVDELVRLEGLFPNRDMQFNINKKAQISLGALSPEHLTVLQGVMSERTLEAILDESPMSDLETLKLIKRLITNRVIKKTG